MLHMAFAYDVAACWFPECHGTIQSLSIHQVPRACALHVGHMGHTGVLAGIGRRQSSQGPRGGLDYTDSHCQSAMLGTQHQATIAGAVGPAAIARITDFWCPATDEGLALYL